MWGDRALIEGRWSLRSHRIAVLTLMAIGGGIALLSLLAGWAFKAALLIAAGCAWTALGLELALKVRYDKLLRLKLLSDYVLESITRGVIAFDLDGRVRLINRAAIQMLEIQEEKAIGADYRKLLGDNPLILSCIREALEEGRTVEDKEIEHVTPSGRKLTLQLNTAVLSDPEEGRVGAILLMKDLSEIKLLQSRIRRADTLAALGRITASLAHEIKNPLSGISINLELLEEVLSEEELKNEAEIREHLNVIAGEIKRLEELVKNLSRFVGTPAMRMTKLKVNDVLDRVLNLVKVEARDQGISIVRRYAELPEIAGDVAQLQQAFLNLIINAIEAMPDGGELTVETEWSRAEGAIKVRISDTGVGIPPEDQDKVFEFYYTTKEEGTGMGLPIALKIIKDHGGEIDLESEPGIGTTFTVTLPVRGEGDEGEDIGGRG